MFGGTPLPRTSTEEISSPYDNLVRPSDRCGDFGELCDCLGEGRATGDGRSVAIDAFACVMPSTFPPLPDRPASRISASRTPRSMLAMRLGMHDDWFRTEQDENIHTWRLDSLCTPRWTLSARLVVFPWTLSALTNN
jgi:hypothetical protein